LKQTTDLRAFGHIYPEFKKLIATMNQFSCNEGNYFLPAWMI
jgi:hypothetical protein